MGVRVGVDVNVDVQALRWLEEARSSQVDAAADEAERAAPPRRRPSDEMWRCLDDVVPGGVVVALGGGHNGLADLLDAACLLDGVAVWAVTNR